MRICILTPRFPFPENGGDVLRINNVARYLKEQNHQLILVSYSQEDSDFKQAYHLYDEIISIPQKKIVSLFYTLLFMLLRRPLQCGYYYSGRMRRCINQVEQTYKPDLYISHLLRMTPYLNNELRSKSIIEMTDALSKTYALSTQSSSKSLKRFIYTLEYKRIKRYEEYVINHFPKVVLVSKSDVEYLDKGRNLPSLACLTNGVNAVDTPTKTYNPNKICFIGNMRTLQNQDAVTFFVEDVLPIITKKNPKAVFYIIGAEPPSRIKNLASDPRIVITGYVENIEAVISDACVAVAPVRIAAGIQNKVLMALGQGVPTIISSLIAPAIPELQDGVNCFIQDDKKKIADRCLQLMNDASLRAKLAEAGFQLVSENYQWNNILHDYEII